MPFDSTYWSDDTIRILPNDSACTANLVVGYRKIKRGWCQGSFFEDGRVCAVGALGVRPQSYRGYEEIHHLGGEVSYLMAALGNNYNTYYRAVDQNAYSFKVIERYNDRLSTTQQDVLNMYQKAIQLSRGDNHAV